eukprot:TRINITY_DN10203_c1_g4_i2.p1 TRINITY_DN10203_c1_g4~~TRINITY_DN10203_c1_g4_i2.p1  ORF type:complete len:375 (+),score=73.34 TRINITY_DN10203_c1_g4_i2:65-1189(+)
MRRATVTLSGRKPGGPRWVRHARARLDLAAAEMRDRCAELRERATEAPWRARLQAWSRLAGAQERWRTANTDFDTWFNARYTEQRAKVQDMLSGSPRARSGGERRSGAGPPVDLGAALLMGAGIGGSLQGYPAVGLLVAGCGAIRAAGRFTAQRVEANDMEGLFRWAPSALRQRQQDIFRRLQSELKSARKLQSYDSRMVDLSWIDYGGKQALDPKDDYTPSKLFDETMQSLSKHPRVLEVCGAEVRVEQDPDKVVYRVVGGVPEVYLGWRIVGPRGAAEVQVKSSASLLDFIYVFPDGRGRYELKPDGFVIRPHGDWSENCSELPKSMKQPFGKHNGRPIYQRDSVFEYDYEVRDFRHGYEGGRFRPWERPMT